MSEPIANEPVEAEPTVVDLTAEDTEPEPEPEPEDAESHEPIDYTNVVVDDPDVDESHDQTAEADLEAEPLEDDDGDSD